ncbi:unnamed protein product [Penicillium salamii]|uniref:Uncharacterized protein n=1 Tax=Penicillium salamii TaxID=1612424 RepID=A0A9W4IJQ7_9EURO|nr:unnamed protein product [Penicillium salamii]CAG7977347.1 unnamed protein product [Penicillium salamii]CAG8029824.1 unnamed protein product [Penicillium salamii]CAG8157517.1 unnamed protein product [Penicillium salamii]CAG8295762.1 unnamed protein product [Penicillium salamii]
MTWLSISRLRSLLSTFIPRVLSPKNRRETVLFGGPDPKRSSTLVCTKSDIPMMSREESILSAPSSSGVSAQGAVLQRLHTVRIWFPDNGTTIMEDVQSKGLDDVVVDAFVLQDLSARHQAQDYQGNTIDAFPADLAVRESGISRVWAKYGIPKFVPLSIDDPIVLNQPTKDLDQKQALCYQRLHSRYLHEYGRRQNLANVLGYEMPVDLEKWYQVSLQDIGSRLRRLGYY